MGSSTKIQIAQAPTALDTFIVLAYVPLIFAYGQTQNESNPGYFPSFPLPTKQTTETKLPLGTPIKISCMTLVPSQVREGPQYGRS